MKRQACKCIYIAAFLALSLAVGFWVYSKKSAIEEPRNVEFQEHTLDIKEIKISQVEEPIWFVKTKNPTVAMHICFKNEGSRNFKDKPGLLPLLFLLLEQGAGPYNATEWRKICSANSVNLSYHINSDILCVSLYIVPEKFQLAMDLLRDGLLNAHLPEDKIDMFKQQIKEDIYQGRIYPSTLAQEEMMKLVYPQDHPYYVTDDDILKSIDKYTREDLVAAYNKLGDPKDAQVIVVGNISEEEVVASFEKLFASLKKHKSNSFKKVEQSTHLFKEGEVIHLKHEDPQNQQTIVLFSHPGVRSNTKEIFAFTMANAVLGSGRRSRLWTELREKLGLVYYADSVLVVLDMASSLRGSASTDPKNRKILISKIKGIFKELAETGITQNELDLQKIALAVSEDLGSAPNIISFLVSCRRWEIPLSEVNRFSHNYYNLTLKGINDTLRKVFDPSKLNFVTIGPDND
jgi:zinc protease